jgi:hypothetical protein
MFGFFFELSASTNLNRESPGMRARMADFVADLEVKLSIPDIRTLSSRDRSGLRYRIHKKLWKLSSELDDFFTIGSSTAAFVSRQKSTSAAFGELISRIEDRLNDNFTIAPNFANAIDALPPEASLSQLIGPALLVLETVLAPVRYEFRTCFVAMPFRRRHHRFYRSVMSPALRAAQLRPIRAWGSLRSEAYQNLLFGLIRKSGHTIADVSGGNANVLMELGYAMGRGRRTLPIAARGESTVSNINRSDIVRYEPTDLRTSREQIDSTVRVWSGAA